MAFDLTKIEDKIDKTAAGSIAIPGGTGLMFQSMLELMEFAKLMAISGAAVPSHLRANPGACLAICTRAVRWQMEPFAVAEKSYLVNNRGEERIAFESQLVHAVIEAHAPITGRLRRKYTGEGDERRCIVWGTPKGEKDPLEFESETLGKRRPSRNDKGTLRGSPLWDSKPDLQLYYDASRDWCRTYFPDILLGVYSVEEIQHIGPDRAKDITPKLAERLAGTDKRGFSAAHVERETAKTVIEDVKQERQEEPDANQPDAETTDEPAAEAEAKAVDAALDELKAGDGTLPLDDAKPAKTEAKKPVEPKKTADPKAGKGTADPVAVPDDVAKFADPGYERGVMDDLEAATTVDDLHDAISMYEDEKLQWPQELYQRVEARFQKCLDRLEKKG